MYVAQEALSYLQAIPAFGQSSEEGSTDGGLLIISSCGSEFLLCATQEALSYLQAMGAVAKLPDDVQWSIRALLMRRLPNVAILPRAAAPVPAGNDPALPQLLGYLLQQMSKVNAISASPSCRQHPLGLSWVKWAI